MDAAIAVPRILPSQFMHHRHSGRVARHEARLVAHSRSGDAHRYSRVVSKYAKVDSVPAKRMSISRLVASSTYTIAVHIGARSSNQRAAYRSCLALSLDSTSGQTRSRNFSCAMRATGTVASTSMS